MSDVWTFGELFNDSRDYADGTKVPSRRQVVLLNGTAVGEIEIHMHRRVGRDGRLDVSFGVTAVVYSPPAGGS